MNTTGNLTGTAYTSDEQYAALTGRVVSEHVTKLGTTENGDTIVRVRRTIDIGRSDAVTPSDPDAQLAPEAWVDEVQKVVKARAQAKLNAIARRAAFEQVVVALMREHGALSMKRLVHLTGRTHCFILPHITERLGTVYRRVEGGRGAAWGLLEGGG